MFQIIIMPCNSNAVATASFLTLESAETANQNICDRKKDGEKITVKDDFGSIISMPAENLCYHILIDLKRSQVMQFEKTLATAAGQEECGKDPRAQALMMGMGQDGRVTN